jgi:hypothetical protein
MITENVIRYPLVPASTAHRSHQLEDLQGTPHFHQADSFRHSPLHLPPCYQSSKVAYEDLDALCIQLSHPTS